MAHLTPSGQLQGGSNLTNIFQMGWNHQLGMGCRRTRPKMPGMTSDGCFFLVVSGIICHSSKPNRGIFEEKKRHVSFWNQGKIAKGRPIVLAEIEFIAALPAGLLFFFLLHDSVLPRWVWPVTAVTRGRRSTSDFWSFTSGSCQENVDLGGEKCWKIPWGDDGVSQFGLMILMDTIQVHNIFVVQRSIDSTLISLFVVYIFFVWLVFVGYSTLFCSRFWAFPSVSPKRLFHMHPDFHGWRPPQERQALAEETEQKNAKALQGRTVSLRVVKAEVFVSFFFFEKNFGSCVGVCFFRWFTNKRNKHQTLGGKTGTRIGYIIYKYLVFQSVFLFWKRLFFRYFWPRKRPKQ